MNRLFIIMLILCVSACSSRKDQPALVLKADPLQSPADSSTALPFLFTDPSGSPALSWVEKHADTSRFYFARYGAGEWLTPRLIAKGSTWFINWADYPMVASDGGARWVAHLLNKSAKGTYAYDIQVYTSSDSGARWNAPFTLHDDGKEAEHGFVSLIPYQDKLFVTWLDGRNAAMEAGDGMDHSGHHGAMSLRAAVMSYSGEKLQEWELDSKTCDCCQTTAAITGSGPVVIYRDRSDEEIRDMSIVRLVNGSWTSPKPIHRDNWKIAGCPVNGPRAAASGNRLAVAWYTAATEPSHVHVVFSPDGGETFGEAVSIDEGKAIGRVDLEWIDESRVVVSWMEGALIRAAVVDTDGNREEPLTIAESSDARSSGFPQMTRAGSDLLFAWTDDKLKRVQTAKVSLTQSQ